VLALDAARSLVAHMLRAHDARARRGALARRAHASRKRSRSAKKRFLYFLLGVVRILSKFGAGCIFFQYLATNQIFIV
jgi:hypothetical protein